MDQLGIKQWINIVVSIKENMNRQITLYLEHIVTIRLNNYKCIPMKHTLRKDTLD
jgi:hypothetical protein